jgi:hypothetical protein
LANYLWQTPSVEQGGTSQGSSLPQQVVATAAPLLTTLKAERSLSKLSLPQFGHLAGSASRLRRKTSETSPHRRHLQS